MDARQLIDFASEDNAKDFREALYASIYDKVNAHIEQKKQEVAHNLVTTQEETDCASKSDAKKIAKKEVGKHEDKMHDDKDDEDEDDKDDKKEVKEETELDEAVSRKHFQQVADLIASHDSHDKRKELAQHHATIFAMQNPRFDRSKFMKASNVTE